MVYQPAGTTVGDPISLSDPKAGALTLSTSLANYEPVSTDAVNMFARRDAFRTVAESIASAMAGVPLDLYHRDEKNGRSKVSEGDHVVADALDEPHPGTTQFRLLQAIHLDRILHDRYAVMMLDTDEGLQLVRLPGRWISFAVDGFRRVTDVVLRQPSNGRAIYIPIARVIFDVGYDPAPTGTETKGFPISRTLAASATELERGAAYRAALLAGGPKVPMYVARPKDAPKWEKGGREFFEQTFQGFSAERAGQVPLLEDGMELKAAPQLVADSVEYKETRLAAQIEFAIAMHFPPELVGYRTGNFSNIAALRELLYVDTLGSEFAAQRQAWNAGLRRGGYLQRGRDYIEENVAIRLMGNPELQASILQTQVGAPVRTVNEARRLLNLPPIEGGDELIVPLNVVKGGLASPTDTGPKTLALEASRLQREPLAIGAKAASPKAYQTRIEKQRERFSADLRKAYKAQASRVERALGDGNSPGPLEDAFDVEADSAALAAVILPHSYAIAQSGALRVLDKYNPDKENYSEEVMLPWLSKAADSTASLIVTGLVAALAARVVAPDWLDQVKGYLADVVDSGPDLWAQTVATSSSSFGAFDAAKASGLGQKTWIHNGSSDKSRPEHIAMDGETVGMGELFSNGLRWPGDPTGSAEDNAQCNCIVEFSRLSD